MCFILLAGALINPAHIQLIDVSEKCMQLKGKVVGIVFDNGDLYCVDKRPEEIKELIYKECKK